MQKIIFNIAVGIIFIFTFCLVVNFIILKKNQVPAPEISVFNLISSESSPTVLVKKQPDAEAPAAGSCANFYEVETVDIHIDAGIPSPRCAKIFVTQKLRILNDTNEKIEFSFAGFDVLLEPQARYVFEKPASDFLLPGVHVMKMDYYGGSGPEIWFIN